MFSALRSTFRKFRTFVRAIRAGIVGLAVVFGSWIAFAPPSQTEIAQLGLRANATAQNEVLRTHRMAKVLMAIATDRTYTLIAARAGNGMTPDDVRLAVAMAAGGRIVDPTATAAADGELNAGGGAKFVSARTN